VNPSKYYPVSNELREDEMPEFTLKNIGLGFLMLGLIIFMVYIIMLYLFVKQEWVMIGPNSSFAGAGVIMMVIGSAIYLFDRFLEKKSK
jgi:uncharacterized protein YjeT (DUF2065 family)